MKIRKARTASRTIQRRKSYSYMYLTSRLEVGESRLKSPWENTYHQGKDPQNGPRKTCHIHQARFSGVFPWLGRCRIFIFQSDNEKVEHQFWHVASVCEIEPRKLESLSPGGPEGLNFITELNYAEFRHQGIQYLGRENHVVAIGTSPNKTGYCAKKISRWLGYVKNGGIPLRVFNQAIGPGIIIMIF